MSFCAFSVGPLRSDDSFSSAGLLCFVPGVSTCEICLKLR